MYPPPQSFILFDERQTPQSLAWAIAAEPGLTLGRQDNWHRGVLQWEAM